MPNPKLDGDFWNFQLLGWWQAQSINLFLHFGFTSFSSCWVGIAGEREVICGGLWMGLQSALLLGRGFGGPVFLGFGGLGPCNAGQAVHHSGTQNPLF